ncbi:MAG: hypothetical protein A2534_02080 [Candidatus Magasanikbacteria bacterium RIFOXYD2_FULL_39_9]|uniref:Uncharacterized protein n=1 Tax=Candidatus Magasanikbacteria bacterium RIFOXYD1_FULL_40_23 TaxID=1798705 RepID=A0A1F6PA21_9BACT|nr:MAG: hypothetical protein A2534_02080 [Candidatus Magasanikbacteria bacterium RIFOXYD2_FULL_39_9]OGH93025.1 MAG: hypothetical protein A2563_05445 [Candidatus Magasanikbacteria bacterium RIFOXYD1_FULL_40_23]
MSKFADKIREARMQAKASVEEAIEAAAGEILQLLKSLDPKDRVDVMLKVQGVYSGCCGEELQHGYCTKCNR